MHRPDGAAGISVQPWLRIQCLGLGGDRLEGRTGGGDCTAMQGLGGVGERDSGEVNGDLRCVCGIAGRMAGWHPSLPGGGGAIPINQT